MARPVLTLPEETVRDLRRLSFENPANLGVFIRELHDAGWGYQPTAKVLDLARETVRQMALRSTEGARSGLVVPQVPPKPEKPSPPELTDEEKARLLRLHKLARLLRAEHPADDPHRVASEELSAFIDELTKRTPPITYRQIGDVLGLRPMTIRERLVRHGYRGHTAARPYTGRRPDKPIEELVTS